MLIARDKFIKTPVMSLQTGGKLAETTRIIINPHNLSVMAFELRGSLLSDDKVFLLVQDIREYSSLGLIVDSNDEFVLLDDIIKLKEVYNLNFHLMGLSAYDTKKTKLGKVINYSLEPHSFLIKQLNIKRPLLKSFVDTELIIDRTQVVEVNRTSIIIESDDRQPIPAKKSTTVYANPFRSTSPQAEVIQPK